MKINDCRCNLINKKEFGFKITSYGLREKRIFIKNVFPQKEIFQNP